MQQLTHKNYMDLCSNATPLARDRYGDKVLMLSNGQILKLFRIKHLISSARIRPYATRFALNAAKLTERGIRTVWVRAVYKIPSISRTAVEYTPIEGVSLCDHLKDEPFTPELISCLAKFMARLHTQGVYFRAIHFGNIIVLPDGGFGLIDVDDMKIYGSSLNLKKRLRNFHHFTKYKQHRDLLRPQCPAFTAAYLTFCTPGCLRQHRFESRLTHLIDR